MDNFAKTFKVGDRLKADDLNAIAKAAFRSNLLPGSFQNSVMTLQAIGNQVPGGTKLLLGLFVDTIPAAAYTVSGTTPSFSVTATHGYTADAVIVMRRKDDLTGWEAEPSDTDVLIVGGVNLSQSRLRASVARPVPMLGYLDTLVITDEAFDVFVPVNWDQSSLYGFDFALPQVPYHTEDSAEFILDAEDCGGS